MRRQERRLQRYDPKLRTLTSQVLRSAAPAEPGPHHEAGLPQIQRKQMRGRREQRPPPPSQGLGSMLAASEEVTAVRTADPGVSSLGILTQCI